MWWLIILGIILAIGIGLLWRSHYELQDFECDKISGTV